MLVVQPDSGDPVETAAKTLEILAERFGANVNAKGLRVLRLVRVIEGDDVNPTNIVSIGTGRKSSIKRGQSGSPADWRYVCKDPVTEPGKRSKRGILGVLSVLPGLRQSRLMAQTPGRSMAGLTSCVLFIETGRFPSTKIWQPCVRAQFAFSPGSPLSPVLSRVERRTPCDARSCDVGAFRRRARRPRRARPQRSASDKTGSRAR